MLLALKCALSCGEKVCFSALWSCTNARCPTIGEYSRNLVSNMRTRYIYADCIAAQYQNLNDMPERKRAEVPCCYMMPTYSSALPLACGSYPALCFWQVHYSQDTSLFQMDSQVCFAVFVVCPLTKFKLFFDCVPLKSATNIYVCVAPTASG